MGPFSLYEQPTCQESGNENSIEREPDQFSEHFDEELSVGPGVAKRFRGPSLAKREQQKSEKAKSKESGS